MQIHPHFLFNTLNTIYGMALKQDAYTPDLILKLSDLLDYILYQINKPYVELSDELNHLKNYIDLEKIRFKETLQITMDVDQVENRLIPPMLLIPFVENSFKHGRHINGKLSINMQAWEEGNCFVFLIANTFISESKHQQGIGLENIRKRLDLLYPNKHQLLIEQGGDMFIVKLKLIGDGNIN